METMKVKPWGDDQGDFVLINAEDFNADFHVPFGAEGGESGEGELSAAQLKDELRKRNIEFRGNASRAVLQGLYDEAVKAESGGEEGEGGESGEGA
jgi:hypothetical protein